MANFTGTPGVDILRGTATDDVINGLGGNDLIEGLDGNDVLNGGSGSDTIYGGAGDDRIEAGFEDTLTNYLYGGDGNDFIIARGADYIEPGTGVDEVLGASGSTVSYLNHLTGLEINLFWRYSWDGTSQDKLVNVENAIGSAQADSITGTRGNNILDPGDGSTDYIYGWDGSDTVSYASSSSGVTVNVRIR